MFEFDKNKKKERFLPQKISERMGLAITLVGVLLFVGFSTVYYFLSLQKTDTIIVDIAGRNRMLSQKIAYYSEMVLNNKKGYNEKLQQVVDLYDNSLYVLKNGGYALQIKDNRFLPPASQSVLPLILETEKFWTLFREKARVIIKHNINNYPLPEEYQALNFIRENGDRFLKKNDSVVKAYVKVADQKRMILLKSLLLVLILGFIIIFSITYILIKIIKSIKNLQKGVQIIREGNLDYKVATKSLDEIGELSRAFDKMTEKIKNLQKDKLVFLEKSKKELEKKVEERTSSLRQAQDSLLEVLVDVKNEKKKIEKDKVKDEAIFKSIGEGLIVLNELGQVTFANKKALEILHCNQDITKLNWKDVLRVKDDQFVYEDDGKTLSFDKMFIKVSEHKIFNFIRNDGTIFPAILAASKIILKEKEIGTVVVFRDVTKEMEVDKAKSEFVSLASHQLRTPLSSINWFSEMLLDGDAGDLNEKQEKYLKEIFKSSKRMTNLVNTLLNVSRIELGTMVIAPVKTDIIKIMDDVLDELKLAAEKRKIDIKIDYQKNLPELKVDNKILRVAFQNLVSNAIKYTQIGGWVKITIKEEGDNVLITVEDNGYGIPLNSQSSIFGKLYRADNVKIKNTEGTGLGLYITKSIIEQSGGKIWFKSPASNGQGTKFFCTVPKTGMKAKAGSRELS